MAALDGLSVVYLGHAEWTKIAILGLFFFGRLENTHYAHHNALPIARIGLNRWSVRQMDHCFF